MRLPLLRLPIALAILLVVLLSATIASAQPASEFKLGFKALADQVPDVVGQPLENEHWGANDDSLQQTTTGLMVWRKADNWTAFTNGARTWINGPYGVVDRGNDERFEWEKDTTPTFKYRADFDSQCQWSASTTEWTTTRCVDGEYEFTIPKARSSAWLTAVKVEDADFDLSVDVKFPSTVPSKGGLIFNSTGSSGPFYAFILDSTGKYSLYLYRSGQQNEYLVSTRTSSAFRGGGSASLLKVKRQGATISLYLNGQPLGSLQHTGLTGNQVGVIAGAGDQGGAKARVDNFLAEPPRGDAATGGYGVALNLGFNWGDKDWETESKATLVHEYTHIMQYDVARGVGPVWFNEGMAELAEYSKVPSCAEIASNVRWTGLAKEQGILITLKQLGSQREQIVTKSSELSSEAYGISFLAVKFLADRVGGMPLLRVLERTANGTDFEQALQALTGYTVDRLDADYRATIPKP